MGLPLRKNSSSASAPQPTATSTLISSGQSTIAHSTSAQDRATGAGGNVGAGITRPKTEAEMLADRLYEEAMEEQYAMREGGA